MFGLTSAPELYQRVTRDLLKTCAGVVNTADDIVAHGATIEEHDRHLFNVLDPLSESGLTLNGKKMCVQAERAGVLRTQADVGRSAAK